VIHIACQRCGTFDIVGPGHPAVTFDEEAQQHVLISREKLRHSHGDDCQPGEDGNYPLAFTFTAEIGPVAT
jgi:hypothetical protein